MKVTVKKSAKTEPKIFIKDTNVGDVFEILHSGEENKRVVVLKLEDEQAVLLNYSSGHTWLEILNDDGWADSPVKILGKLTEIIVDPKQEQK